MRPLHSKNKNIKYLLCVEVFTKYAWVQTLKDKKGKTVVDAFDEIVNKSTCNPNKLWVDQGREFYNKAMQEWLDNNNVLMHSTHNEGKSVIAERFIKMSKAEICKKKTANDSKFSVSYLDKLVDHYNNTNHHSIVKKPINTDYFALTEKIEANPETPKFQVRIVKETIESESY